MSAKTSSNGLKKTNITSKFAGIIDWKVTIKYIQPFRKKIWNKKNNNLRKTTTRKGQDYTLICRLSGQYIKENHETIVAHMSHHLTPSLWDYRSIYERGCSIGQKRSFFNRL